MSGNVDRLMGGAQPKLSACAMNRTSDWLERQSRHPSSVRVMMSKSVMVVESTLARLRKCTDFLDVDKKTAVDIVSRDGRMVWGTTCVAETPVTQRRS